MRYSGVGESISEIDLGNRDDQFVDMEAAFFVLIRKLEIRLQEFNALSQPDFYRQSATVARATSNQLIKFVDQNLEAKAVTQVHEEFDRVFSVCRMYEQVLQSQSLTNAMFRECRKVESLAAIQSAHSQLGEALTRGCATVCYHAVVLIGSDSGVAQQIDERTVRLVQELQAVWKF